MEQLLLMSQKERKKLIAIEQHTSGKLTVKETAELLGLSQRQVYRLLKRKKQVGDSGIVHKLRGKPSNRGHGKEIQEKVLNLYWKNYRDFGPTLFAEKLQEKEKISIDHETLRRWMRANGIITGQRKSKQHRKRRERMSASGAMLQLDGSYHAWFENRGAICCLMNLVDDATGKIYLKFTKGETTAEAMHFVWEYSKQYGLPGKIYTDRHSAYYSEDSQGDFLRAMKRLEIEVIFAHSPQAKGRVERSHRTLQDRLVKEMRLRGIATIEDGNLFLRTEFLNSYNEKFGVRTDAADVHRQTDGMDLAKIFSFEVLRQVKNDYTYMHKGKNYQIEFSGAAMPHPKDNVYIRTYLDGTVHIFNSADEELTVKPLKERLRTQTIARPHCPAHNHPWR